MEQRKIIKEQIIIDIPVLPNRQNNYKPGILWQELLLVKDALPTDIISEIGYRMEKESGFGSMKTEDELEEIPVATLVVIRNRPETDDEFFNRKQKEESLTQTTRKRKGLNI